jgi:hypothetical protein
MLRVEHEGTGVPPSRAAQIREGDMRKSAVLSGLLWLLVGLNGASAADYSVQALTNENYQPISWAPTFSVVGTLSATWTDNSLFSRDNRRSDGFIEPDVSLRLNGRLAPDWTYRLYARTEFERFSRVRDADGAFALWGARITRNVAGWSASAIYENRYQFAGIYDEHLFTAHDIKAAVSRSFTFGIVTLSPFAQGRYRFSDLVESEYWRVDLALGIEARLNERWSIVSEPFFEAFWFTGGLNSGRADQIYSVSLGVKYDFTPSVSLVTMVAYEERFSNVDVRRYRSLDVGPKLNFAF